MKHKLVLPHKEWPRWTPLAVFGLIVCVVWFALAVDGLPATYNKRLYFYGDYDSVQVIWGKNYTDSSILTDTTCVTSIPGVTSIAVDKAYDWDFVYIYYSDDDSASVGDFIKFTAGAATVSTEDMLRTAGFVRDTLDEAHGTESWITGGIGTGSDTVQLVALDTSGTDATIADVEITVYNPSGEKIKAGTNTNAYGKRELALNPASGYHAYFRRTGYIFPSHSFDVSGNDDSLPIPGYNIELLASPTPNYCRVQGYVGGVSGVLNKATVSFTVVGGPANNDCDTMLLVPLTETTLTDTVGYFYQDLIYSSCLIGPDSDSLQYNVVVTKRGSESKSVLITVPDSASYRVVW